MIDTQKENLDRLEVRKQTDEFAKKEVQMEVVDEINERGSDPDVDDHCKVCVTWKDLNLTFKDTKILTDVSGSLRPGELVGIIGPSGSGKTTLLRLLSGQVDPKCWTGDVLVNGKDFDPLRWGSKLGVVEQKDVLIGTLTPRDSISFSANLRLEQDVDIKERVVNDLIKNLGIEKCADTLIGNEMIVGISGGELKRTCIANELVTNPKCLFLDEPLSGLDSYMAYQITHTLKELTQEGRTIMLTVHQPSPQIANLFDRFIVMMEGEILCQGNEDELKKFAHSIGIPCPIDMHILDHLIFEMQKVGTETTEQWLTHSRKFPVDVPDCKDMTDIDDIYHFKGYGLCTQVSYLLTREAKSLWQNKMALIARFMIPIFMAVFLCSVFYQIGAKGDGTAIFGGVFVVALSSLFGSAQPTIFAFSPERPVFLAEYRKGMYGILPYFIIKNVSDAVLGLITMMPTIGVYTLMMGLHGNYVLFVFYIWLMTQATVGMVIAICASVTDVQTVNQLFPLIILPQIFFAGFYIRIEQIPVALQWIQYICPLKYGLNLVLINEFRDVDYLNAEYPGDGADIKALGSQGAFLLEQNQITASDEVVYLACLFGMVALFRSLAVTVLWRNAEHLID